MALRGQYLLQVRHPMHFSPMTLMPHVDMASTGQKTLHCPHPTHASVIFKEITSFLTPSY
jgi:hypothetical protein